MPLCPVCENQQPAGDACDVCGRPFAVADRSGPPVPPVEGLELTRHEPVPEPRDAMPELEPTRAAPVAAGEAGLAAVEGLEPTGHGEAGAVAAEPVEGLEATAAPDLPDDPAPRGPVVCRYCRTPATGWEKLCARCGMHLPLLRQARRGAAAAAPPCSDCGTPVPGAQCPACGARRHGG